MESGVKWIPCVKCWAVGFLDNCNRLPAARHERLCDYCMGRRFVLNVTCRGCGRPSLKTEAGVTYCSRKECWERLTEEYDPDKVVSIEKGTGFVPFGNCGRSRIAPWYGPREDMATIEMRARRCGMSVAEFLVWMERV
jgi:hypothetical protein